MIDNGTGMCRIGFAGEAAPRASFPMVVGLPRVKTTCIGNIQRDLYVGSEAIALAKTQNLQLKRPISVSLSPLHPFISSPSHADGLYASPDM